MKTAKLWYFPVSQGDGSVSVKFFSTEEKMRAYITVEEASPYHEHWGEDCSGDIVIGVSDEGIITSPEPRFDPDPRTVELIRESW